MPLKSILQQTLAWSLLLLILVSISPLLLLLFIYREVIVFCRNLTSTLGDEVKVHPLTRLDHAFCTDPFHTRPRGGTSFIWICEGRLDPTSVLGRFSFLEQNPSDFRYSRLTSLIPETWMGIPFWRKCSRAFRMKDHFKVMTPGSVGQSELDSILVEWMKSGFIKGQPLWEFMLIPGLILDGEQRSVLGLKIHHTIGDGYSKLRLLERIVDESPVMEKNDVIIDAYQSAYQWPCQSLSFSEILRLPSTVWKLVQDFLLHKDDVWTSTKTSDEVVLLRANFPLKDFKEIRKLFSAKYCESSQPHPPPPLLLLGVALLVGALRRYKEEMPKNCVNFVAALPIQGVDHPPEFCNYWTLALLNVEIGEESPRKRLEKLLDNYKTWVELSHWPQIYSGLILPFQSLLPSWVWGWMTGIRMGAPFGVTNMIGPSKVVAICGAEVLEKYAYVGLLWANSCLTAGFFSYAGNLSLTLVANRDLAQLSPNFKELLTKYFLQEMDLLKSELAKEN